MTMRFIEILEGLQGKIVHVRNFFKDCLLRYFGSLDLCEGINNSKFN